MKQYILVGLASLATNAYATVVLGQLPENGQTWAGKFIIIIVQSTITNKLVAWVGGQDPCGTPLTVIAEDGNPCGHQFGLQNGFTYSLGNCGSSPLVLYNSDGSFNSNCYPSYATFNCAAAQTYACG